MAKEDPIAKFRNSSPQHAARITPGGALILSVLVNGNKNFLIDFQLVARKALKIAHENNRGVRSHTVRGSRGEQLYDQIIIYHP